MRIALLTESCDNETGIGRIVLALAREFKRAGHTVHVLGQRIKDLEGGISGHVVPSVSPYNAIKKLVYPFTASSILRELRCDVADSFGVGSKAQVVTAQSCHRAAMTRLRQCKGKRIWRRNWGVYDRVSLHTERRLFTSPNTRKIIAVSALIRDEIITYYQVPPTLITVIPNGVDYGLLAGAAATTSREEVRSDLNLSPEHFVWLFVGNEFDRKGLQNVIESIAQGKDKSDRLLVIGGDDAGPYRALATRLNVHDQVMFLGRVAGPERFFASADAFVFPTLYEAFGLVILEAMAAGIPVVTSKMAGAVEGLEDGKHGLFLDDPLSVNELTATMERLKNDSRLRSDIIWHAREAASKFSWNLIAARTLEVFQQVR